MQIAKHIEQTASSTSTLTTSNDQNLSSPKHKSKGKPVQTKSNPRLNQHAKLHQIKANSNSNSLTSMASSGDISILPHNSSYYNENAVIDRFASQHSVDSQNSIVDLNFYLIKKKKKFFYNEKYILESGSFIESFE